MRSATVLVLLVAALVPTALNAQVTGAWTIQADFIISEREVQCFYAGTATFTQSGDQVTGPIDLAASPNNPDGCPSQLSGNLAATLTGTSFMGTITGTVDSGQPIVADIQGMITVQPAALLTKAAMTTMLGTSRNQTGGPFASVPGNFSGQLQMALPTAGPVALAALVVLLLAGSTWLLRRRRA